VPVRGRCRSSRLRSLQLRENYKRLVEIAGMYTPVILYMVLTLIPFAMDNLKSSPVFIGINVGFILLQALFLNYLCSTGYSLYVWIYVLFLVGLSITSAVYGEQHPAEMNDKKRSTKNK
jgi:hypothetical protein